MHYVGLLLLPILSIVTYNWIFDYTIVYLRDTSYSFFMFGSEFFLEFLDRPGGLLRYAGRFLTQFYHYEWLGALTNCLLITCFAVLFHLVLRRLRRTVWVLHTLLPCILLLTVLRHNVIPITLELLTMSAAFLGYLSLRRRVVRQVYALTAIPALYLIAGGCFWFFVVWVTASEWLARPRSSNLTFKLLYAVLAVCLPLAAYRWLLLIPLSNAFTYPLNVYVASSSSSVIMLSAHVLLVGYMLVVPFAERISRGTRPGSAQDSTRHMAVRVVLLIVLSALLLRVSYNSEEGESSDYHELYKRRQWDAILKKAKHNRRAMAIRLILLFTFVPIIELMLLIRLGVRIGALNAILVVLVTGILGALLVRWQGLAVLSRIRSDLGLGIVPTRELFDGALVLIGGLLLLTPGLITDAIGLGLLVPITRRVVRNWLRAGLRKRAEAGRTGFYGRWHF